MSHSQLATNYFPAISCLRSRRSRARFRFRRQKYSAAATTDDQDPQLGFLNCAGERFVLAAEEIAGGGITVTHTAAPAKLASRKRFHSMRSTPASGPATIRMPAMKRARKIANDPRRCKISSPALMVSSLMWKKCFYFSSSGRPPRLPIQ